jgi:hypothetical protein
VHLTHEGQGGQGGGGGGGDLKRGPQVSQVQTLVHKQIKAVVEVVVHGAIQVVLVVKE